MMARIASVVKFDGMVLPSEVGAWNRVGYACSEEVQEAVSSDLGRPQ